MNNIPTFPSESLHSIGFCVWYGYNSKDLCVRKHFIYGWFGFYEDHQAEYSHITWNDYIAGCVYVIWIFDKIIFYGIASG